MKENKYDDPHFFEKYSQMARSREGLAGAGEWRELEKLLPDFSGRRVLDLGCGYGWHCKYAAGGHDGAAGDAGRAAPPHDAAGVGREGGAERIMTAVPAQP